MVRLREYLGPDGVSIRWGYLGATLFGAGLLAWFEGAVATILATGGVLLTPGQWFASFAGAYIEALIGSYTLFIREGWAGAIPFVTSAGIAGYAVAITIVLLTVLPFAWVIARVR